MKTIYRIILLGRVFCTFHEYRDCIKVLSEMEDWELVDMRTTYTTEDVPSWKQVDYIVENVKS